jgi:hypothetical protein
MAKYKKRGDKNSYDFSDGFCISRSCWCPGMFNHYNKSISGSNSCTHQTAECLNRAYHGCDKEYHKIEHNLEIQRKEEGWKQTY